jgi:hypothetical protein
LTFFQRIKTPFTESPAEEQARLQPRMRLIGELLQERREDLGLDLDEIGAMLRIKPAYLAALEQGRTHDLPGPTYAIGFVRASGSTRSLCSPVSRPRPPASPRVPIWRCRCRSANVACPAGRLSLSR